MASALETIDAEVDNTDIAAAAAAITPALPEKTHHQCHPPRGSAGRRHAAIKKGRGDVEGCKLLAPPSPLRYTPTPPPAAPSLAPIPPALPLPLFLILAPAFFFNFPETKRVRALREPPIAPAPPS